MSDATGVSAFFDMVRKERAEAEKFNQPSIDMKIEQSPVEKPAEASVEQPAVTAEQPAGESTEAPAAEAPAGDATE